MRVRRFWSQALFLDGSAGQRGLVVEVWVAVLEGMRVRGVVVVMVVAGMTVVASVEAVVLVLVVVDPRCQAYIFLHMRGEEDRVSSALLQNVQGGHLRSGKTVNLQF